MSQYQLKRAVALNNKAVGDLLHFSKRQCAYDSLKHAYQMIRRIAMRTKSSSSNSSANSAGCCCHDTFSFSFGTEHVRSGYIYNQLLIIDIENLPTNPGNAAEISLAIVVLNLALVYHSESLRSRTKGSIEMSVGLYNHALNVLGYAANKGTAGLIRVAALNNITQLRNELGHFLLARESLQQLALMVSSSSFSIDRMNNGPSVEDEVKKGMLMNILTMSNQHGAPAA
eukprot:scaffold1336_cov158-Cylindrotheca_fusiformis.AAC.9